jgi:hypothetical protein
MPPIRSRTSVNSAERDDKNSLAMQTFKKGDTSNITAAARTFKILRLTLRDRLYGHAQRGITRANSCKLTEFEKEPLEKWILSMDSQESAP